MTESIEKYDVLNINYLTTNDERWKATERKKI